MEVGAVIVLVRLTAIVFAVLLSAQAALPGGTMWVCRYTGQRIDPCACPQPKPIQDERILPRGCCEFRQGHLADVAGVVRAVDSRPLVHAVELPAVATWQPPEPSEQPGLRVRNGHDPPPRERLFLSLRQLLI